MQSESIMMTCRSPPQPTNQLSLLQMFLLSAMVFGVEVSASAGFTYIPPMLLKAGLLEENMSMILGMGPLLGFIFVPMIGRASDACRSPYGRRRPFIFLLGVFLILSLIIVPNAESVCVALFGKNKLSYVLGICSLTFGVVLLDFTSQACLTPCEALLSDASYASKQTKRIFMINSMMCSLGGCVGYLVTGLEWNSTAIGQFFGGQEKSVFSFLIIIVLITMGATLLIAGEGPYTPHLDDDKNSEDLETELNGSANASLHLESGYETSSNSSMSDDGLSSKRSLIAIKNTMRSRVQRQSCGCLNRLMVRSIFDRFCNQMHRRLPRTIQNLLDVPIVLRKLALANLFTWSAVMAFNLFYTDFVGQIIYGGNPNAPENSHLQKLYDEGVRMGSWGLLYHCITSAVLAPLVEPFCDKYGPRATYLVGMICFILAMIAMTFINNIVLVNALAAFAGIPYAILTFIPFVIVSTYHADKEVSFM